MKRGIITSCDAARLLSSLPSFISTSFIIWDVGNIFASELNWLDLDLACAAAAAACSRSHSLAALADFWHKRVQFIMPCWRLQRAAAAAALIRASYSSSCSSSFFSMPVRSFINQGNGEWPLKSGAPESRPVVECVDIGCGPVSFEVFTGMKSKLKRYLRASDSLKDSYRADQQQQRMKKSEKKEAEELLILWSVRNRQKDGDWDEKGAAAAGSESGRRCYKGSKIRNLASFTAAAQKDSAKSERKGLFLLLPPPTESIHACQGLPMVSLVKVYFA